MHAFRRTGLQPLPDDFYSLVVAVARGPRNVFEIDPLIVFAVKPLVPIDPG
jgi:hypothetical protein